MDKKNEELKSIYETICELAKSNNETPYNFQDPEFAGFEEKIFFMQGNLLPIDLRKHLAKWVVENLKKYINGEVSKQFLDENVFDKSFLIFLPNLQDRLYLYLKSKYIDKQKLYFAGVEFATKGKSKFEVCIGIIILGFFENDFVKNIFYKLGLHSEFTYYVIVASREFDSFNDFYFELSKKTIGIGKIFALNFFEPITDEQKDWLFNIGVYDMYNPFIISGLCFHKSDMFEYYETLEVTKENFSTISYIISHVFIDGDIKNSATIFSLLYKYMMVAEKFAKNLIDLHSIITIYEAMEHKDSEYPKLDLTDDELLPFDNDKKKVLDYILEHYDEQEDAFDESEDEDSEIHYDSVGDWNPDIIESYSKICKNILNLNKWNNIAIGELSQAKYHPQIYIDVIEFLDMAPSFESFYPLLEKDNYDGDIFEFTVINNPQYYNKSVIEYLKYVIPEELLVDYSFDNSDFDAEDVDSEYAPEVWIHATLENMATLKQYDEEFLIMSLKSRITDVRTKAIDTFKIFKDQLSEGGKKNLLWQYQHESNSKIKNKILRLLSLTKREALKLISDESLKSVNEKKKSKIINIFDKK